MLLRTIVLMIASVAFLASGSAQELDRKQSRESLLRQQLQHLLHSIELLQEAGQQEIADKVAVEAERIARQLNEMQQRRDEQLDAAAARKRAQQQAQWREEVLARLDKLETVVVETRREINLLRDELAEFKRTARAKEFAKVDLSGTWKLVLPAGFEYEAKVSSRGDGLYQFDVPTVMRGVYRHRGDRVAIEIPSDERLTEFVWEFQNKNLLMLVESPPVAKTGSDYRGATLQRLEE